MKKLQRVLSFCLLLSLTISIFYSPLPASATSGLVEVSASTGLVEIATSYGDVVQVAPYLLPFILILIGLDWYYSNIDVLVAKADSLYVNGSTALKNWADNVAQQIIDGTSVFKIPTAQRVEINNNLNNDDQKLPDYLPYVAIPSTLLALNTLTQSDLFLGDITGIGLDIQEGIDEANTFLNAIKTFIYNSQSQLLKWQQKLNSNITNRLLIIRQAIVQAQNSLKTTTMNIKTEIEDMKISLKTTTFNIKSRLDDIYTSFKTTLLNIKREIEDTRIALVDGLKVRLSDLQISLVNKLDLIYSKLVLTTADPGQIPSFEGSDNGQQKIPVVIDHGKDLLSKYSTAFLAVSAMLTAFINLPVVGDLLQFSLALGIFALVVNLANQLASLDKKGAKSYKASSSKGG